MVIKILIVVSLMGWISGCTYRQGAVSPNASSVKPINLPAVPDGTFRGSHRVAKINYQVDVTVETHQIKSIRIIKAKKRVFEKKCALCKVESLIQEVVNQQTLPVDAVSGATQTSYAILKAIEDALRPPYRTGSGG